MPKSLSLLDQRDAQECQDQEFYQTHPKSLSLLDQRDAQDCQDQELLCEIADSWSRAITTGVLAVTCLSRL